MNEWKEYLEKLSNQYKNILFSIPNVNDVNNIAVIVEPREHEDLKIILQNFMYWLNYKSDDEKWGLMIFHGNNNILYIKNILSDITDKPENINLVNLGVDNLTTIDYSRLLCTKNFWEKIPCENIIIFQTDTILFRKFDNKWFQYDYIGAPWTGNIIHYIYNSGIMKLSTNPRKRKKQLNQYISVGNGGLSFRKKSVILRGLQIYQNSRPDICLEDIFYSWLLKTLNYKIPDEQEAKSFSIEHLFHPKSFGAHKCYEYLDHEHLAILFS